MRTQRRARWSAATLIVAAAIALVSVASNAGEDRLRITSPESGIIVHPGDAVTISVSADYSLEKIALIGEHPLGVGVVIAGGAPGIIARGLGDLRPIQFTIKIPAGIETGAYHVTAIGKSSSGDVESEAVALQVEKSQPPVRIWSEPASIQFNRVGDQIPIRVLGAFGDGSNDEITRSLFTSYVSADPRIATVSRNGMVSALAAGKTTILVTSRTFHYSIPVQVQ